MEKLYDEFAGFLQPTSATIFQDVIERVNPQSILEVGFFKGGSAFFWLSFSNARLLCVDSMRWEGCSIENIKKLIDLFPERFAFIGESSTKVYSKLRNVYFDLFFIDGGHTSDLVINDIQLGIDLNIPYLFLDDVSPNIFQLFQRLTKNKYEVIKIYDRKADQEWIHMILARRIRVSWAHLVGNEEMLLEERIDKWQRVLNEKPVEIPSIWRKLKRKVCW